MCSLSQISVSDQALGELATKHRFGGKGRSDSIITMATHEAQQTAPPESLGSSGNTAAIMIQKTYRGYRARRKLAHAAIMAKRYGWWAPAAHLNCHVTLSFEGDERGRLRRVMLQNENFVCQNVLSIVQLWACKPIACFLIPVVYGHLTKYLFSIPFGSIYYARTFLHSEIAHSINMVLEIRVVLSELITRVYKDSLTLTYPPNITMWLVLQFWHSRVGSLMP